jgi:hypothetical protein
MFLAILTNDHMCLFSPLERPGGEYFCAITVDETAEDAVFRPLILGGDGRPKVYASEAEIRRMAPYDLEVVVEYATRLEPQSPAAGYLQRLKGYAAPT